MRDNTETWLNYANDNLKSAVVLLDSLLFNPCAGGGKIVKSSVG